MMNLVGFRRGKRTMQIQTRTCRTIGPLALLLIFWVGGFDTGLAQNSTQDLASDAQALKLITETAASICYTIEQQGGRSEAKISGEAEAKLNGLIGKVADLGIKGAANLQREAHEGVLQDQLATAIQSSANCRKSVFDKLQEKLLPSQGPRGENQNDTPAKYPESSKTKVNSFSLTSPPNEFKPGRRTWTRIAEDLWQQVYPDGTKGTLRVIKRINVGSCDGGVIILPPDEQFQSFIPDKGCPNMMFLFRRLPTSAWTGYVPLENIR
jgi:hypothetical protein